MSTLLVLGGRADDTTPLALTSLKFANGRPPLVGSPTHNTFWFVSQQSGRPSWSVSTALSFGSTAVVPLQLGMRPGAAGMMPPMLQKLGLVLTSGLGSKAKIFSSSAMRVHITTCGSLPLIPVLNVYGSHSRSSGPSTPMVPPAAGWTPSGEWKSALA